MQALRIKLRQNKAHYGRPECVDNRMTYPLPPYSTVIGALHTACGYKNYQPMDISIQGKYQSMQMEVHNQQILLNHREDDRGILIYLQNPELLTAGYEEVAKALKTQGNSFKNNITIDIVNQIKMAEYWDLLGKKENFELESQSIKDKKQIQKQSEKEKKERLKTLDKKSQEYQKLAEEIKKEKAQWQQIEEEFKQRKELECDRPLTHFQTLTKAPKYVEVLYDVELMLHIQADEDVLSDIEKSIPNLTCLGRSEDFVDIIEYKRVELCETPDKEYLNSQYSAYIQRCHLDKNEETGEENIFLLSGRDEHKKIPVSGTTYFLPKKYEITDKGRQFEYKKVVYLSGYGVDDCSKGIYVDKDGYIVDFV